MALTDRVTERYSAQLLKNLTNPDAPAAAAVDAARLGFAAADVERIFQAVTGVAYDDTVALHVAYAVEGVVAILQLRGGAPSSVSGTAYERWERRLRDAARVLGRDRVALQTTSDLTPTVEVPAGETVRPAFDPDAFDGYAPGRP